MHDLESDSLAERPEAACQNATGGPILCYYRIRNRPCPSSPKPVVTFNLTDAKNDLPSDL